MAGGKGTRLKSISKDIPKPMVPILNKPILEYQIESLRKSGIYEVTIIVGHLGESIKEYFNDGHKWGINIEYIHESQPLGTAGALYYLKGKVLDDFLLIFGDLILDIEWNRFIDFHKKRKGAITLFGHPNSHPYDSDVIVMDETNKVVGIDSKNNERNYFYHNFINAGLYCVSPAFLELIEKPGKIDLEKELIVSQISLGKVFAYKSTEYVKDMGTPDRFYSVIDDVKNGIVESHSLRNKQKCIFLDRDGTINHLNGFINSAEQFEIMADVDSAIKRINASKYLSIIATNQPVIARGECSFEELNRIHMKMETELGEKGAYIDDLLFCPHHPHKGYEGEVSELKIDCDCRKPRIGMITAAAEKYNIDLRQSWYIGDSTMDIQTGINAGMRTVLVKTGECGKDGKYNTIPDYIAKNLLQAVDIILNSEE